MKNWKDLSVEEQSEYTWGMVSLHGFEWECYWKFESDDWVEIYSEYSGYDGPQYTSEKSLVVWKMGG